MLRNLALAAYISVYALVLFAQPGPPPQGAPEDCWGSDKPCADGKYRDRQGKEQPESCDNDPEYGSAQFHDCKCARMQEPEHCDPSGARVYEGPTCSVNCRGDRCGCKNSCDD